MGRRFLLAGGLLAAIAVTLGAFGAHALTGLVTESRLATWQTGVEYHLFHAAGLILVGLTINAYPGKKWLYRCGWLMLFGTIVFSGTLYALVLLDKSWLGAVTPLGGTALIASWLLYVIGLMGTGDSE